MGCSIIVEILWGGDTQGPHLPLYEILEVVAQSSKETRKTCGLFFICLFIFNYSRAPSRKNVPLLVNMTWPCTHVLIMPSGVTFPQSIGERISNKAASWIALKAWLYGRAWQNMSMIMLQKSESSYLYHNLL